MPEEGVPVASEGAAPAAPSASKSSGLDLKGVSKAFPGGTLAVDDFNLHVDHGEYVVLLGPSGCGKTTTLRMIGGHDFPTSGDILLDGESLVSLPPHKRPTTTVFQHFALFPHRTVLQNVEFGLKMHGVSKDERRRQALESLDMVGLRAFAERKPRQLSGGQQQRVALARVLVTKPKALLLDEPLGDLDRLLQLRMRVELRSLQRDLGITFIHVTHNQEEALSMSDRIVVMEGGRIQQIGTPTDLSRHPKNVFVARFMGDNNTIRGPVESSEGGVVTIVGQQARARVNGSREVGAEAAMTVRASAIKVSTDPQVPDFNAARARLNFAEYLGDSVKLHLDVQGQPFLAKVDEHRYAELAKAEGSDVTVSWDAADAQLLEL
jgi:putative spermidine/putrescine transport system ATP-binding protein